MMEPGNPSGMVDVLCERLTGTRVRRVHVGSHITSAPFISVLTVGPNGIVMDLGEPTILGVESIGDTTAFEFMNQIVLVVHNTVHTKWSRYHPSTQWRSPALRLSVAIWTDHDAFVCNGAQSIEFLRRQQVAWDNLEPTGELITRNHESGTERLWGLRRVAGR